MYVVIIKSDELNIRKGFKFDSSKDAVEKIEKSYDELWNFIKQYYDTKNASGHRGKYEASICTGRINIDIFSIKL